MGKIDFPAGALEMKRRENTEKSADAFSKIIGKLFSPLIFSVIASAGFGVFSILIGQDVNWDLLNYHYYNGYAFFNGLEQYHIFPAQIQTFHNPTLDLPFFLMITHWPPMLTGFVLGLLHGLNFTLLFFLADRVLFLTYADRLSFKRRVLIALFCAVVGITAPFFVMETGTTMGDSLTSVLVLGALLLLFSRGPEILPGPIALSGFLAGAAAGLKLTNLIFVLGLVLCGWWVRREFGQAMRRLGLFVVGAGAGWLAFHGHWSWQLFRNYRNPLFPFYNRWFKSPYMDPINWRDVRFVPSSFADACAYPFQWALGRHPSSELAFRDWRFAFVAVALVACALVLTIRFFRRQDDNLQQTKISLLLFFFLSYLIWIGSFAYQRYIVLLELLSGLCLFLLLETILKIRKTLVPLFFVVAVTVIWPTRYPEWWRASWGSSWFDIRIPASLKAHRQMVIILGSDPLAYLIPSFPKDTKFVRLGGNFVPAPRSPFGQLIGQTVREHRGEIYSLSRRKPNPKHAGLLANYGLAVTPRSGIVFGSKAHPIIHVFRLTRKTEPAGNRS